MKTVIDFIGYHKFFEIFEEIRDTEFDISTPEFQKFIENIMLLKVEK